MLNRLLLGLPVFFQFVEQGFETDPEDFSGAGFVVLCVLKRQENEGLLSLRDRCTDGQANRIHIGRFDGRPGAYGDSEITRKMSRSYAALSGNNHGALQHVSQFANVTGPSMTA